MDSGSKENSNKENSNKPRILESWAFCRAIASHVGNKSIRFGGFTMNITTIVSKVQVTEKGVKKVIDTPGASFDGVTFVVLSEVQKLVQAFAAADVTFSKATSPEAMAKREKAGELANEFFGELPELNALYLAEIKASKWADCIEAAVKEGPEAVVAELRQWVDENSTSNWANYQAHAFGLFAGMKAKAATRAEFDEFMDDKSLRDQAWANYQARAKFTETGAYQLKSPSKREGGLKVQKATV